MRHWLTALSLCLPLATAHAGMPSPAAAQQLAEEAYVFAYATAEHNKVLNAIAAKLPFNVLYNEPRLMGPEDNKVVSPNNDTFYSRALLDLRSEPQVLQVPAVEKRYYSFQLIDVRTNNLDYIGTRATGTAAGRYLIVGPAWKGELPAGFNGLIRSTSQLVFLLGRTEVKGQSDQAAAAEILKGYRLQALSSVLGQTVPAALPKLKLPTYRNSKDGQASDVFVTFNALAPLQAWTPAEQTQLSRFAEIGVGPGLDFNPPAAIAQAVASGAETGREKVKAASLSISPNHNGWFSSPANAGHFGSDDLTRAAAAWRYIYVNDPVEALYPIALQDAKGKPLNGNKAYRLHFAAGQLPPVDSFWSLTLYDAETQLFSANPLKRYSLGDRSPSLTYDADGGLTLLIQNSAPAQALQGNWLPAPKGPFNMILRLYLPQQKALQGAYQLPAIESVASQE
ncbi:DUF1254 domain-containing protein [Pseudomonas cavernicola]|uniref:DUF1254 domain-containing protein n=1 Tax=Pseudomonas cavernicola TaxID=2320866 RepID=A0A418XFB4_9PSED|nr:DUF1254 domain-containing protein [Pseudomonas cavernicola]RJG11083.1 DUF1254 domain-containing protein [Pseudomonas cavernicola]